jgi:hypothetical protein
LYDRLTFIAVAFKNCEASAQNAWRIRGFGRGDKLGGGTDNVQESPSWCGARFGEYREVRI